MITAAVLSYNSIFPYASKEVATIYGSEVIFLPHAFNPKCPASVRPDDEQCAELLKHYDTLKKVFVFAGKKESGAFEIIALLSEMFRDKIKALFFILCEHDLKEKLSLLSIMGIAEEQKMIFTDAHLQCRETPVMLGYLYHHLACEEHAMA